jgi:hypothetical protein
MDDRMSHNLIAIETVVNWVGVLCQVQAHGKEIDFIIEAGCVQFELQA